jgi:hypothetical protein
MSVGGLRFEHIQRPNTTSKLDLTLSIIATDRVVTGGFEYCTALFKRQTIQEVSENYQRILQGVADDPMLSIVELRIGLNGNKLRLPVLLTTDGEEEEAGFNF